MTVPDVAACLEAVDMLEASDDLVKRLWANAEFFKQQLSAMGLEPVGNPAAEFSATVRSEIKQWADVIRRAGIKPE